MSTIVPTVTDAAPDGVRRDGLKLATEYVAPRGAIEERLAELWQETLCVDRIGRLDNFFEVGGNSLLAVALLLDVEKEFGVEIPPSTILDRPTIESLATLLSGDERSYSERCLVPLQPKGAEPPLFLLHELGGNLFLYKDLVERLGEKRKIYGIQHPGQNETPIPRFSIPELAGFYIGAIKHVQPCGPYLLAGFSFGGTVAYEMACQLRALGDQVGLLALLDASNRDGQVRGAQRLALKLSQYLAELSEYAPSTWPRYLVSSLRKPRSERLSQELDTGLPNPMTAELPENIRKLMFETLTSAYNEYAAPVYDGEVKLFRSNGPGARWARRHLGWRDRALGGVEVIEVHGHHWSVVAPPGVGLVAEYMSSWIDQALRQ